MYVCIYMYILYELYQRYCTYKHMTTSTKWNYSNNAKFLHVNKLFTHCIPEGSCASHTRQIDRVADKHSELLQ